MWLFLRQRESEASHPACALRSFGGRSVVRSVLLGQALDKTSLSPSLARSFGRFCSGKPSTKPPSLTHGSSVACIFCSGKPSPKNAGSFLAPASLSPRTGWVAGFARTVRVGWQKKPLQHCVNFSSILLTKNTQKKNKQVNGNNSGTTGEVLGIPRSK